jgi:hypothetical protein
VAIRAPNFVENSIVERMISSRFEVASRYACQLWSAKGRYDKKMLDFQASALSSSQCAPSYLCKIS